MPTILIKKSDTPGSVPGTANLTNLAGGAEVAVNTADRRMYSMNSSSAVVELGTNPSSLTCADGSFTLLKAASASITNLTATSLVLSNLSIASANVTTLTSASATITNLLATSLTISAGTANGVLYLNGSKVATSGSALWFDGTNFGIGTGGNTLNQQSVVYKVGANAVYQQVANGSTGLAATNGVRLGVSSSGTGELYSPTALISYIDNAEGMRLTSTGLGIGTSSPAYKLDVAGNINAGVTVGVNNSSSGASAISRFIAIGDAGNAVFGMTSSAYTDITGAADSMLLNASSASGGISFALDGVLRMKLDSSGNLGLGVTPSAWVATNGYRAMQIGGVGIYGRDAAANELYLTSNAFNSATGFKYIYTAAATQYAQLSGSHVWYNAASGTAGNAITFTQAMTLDASGNLGIGTTTPLARLNVVGSPDGTFNSQIIIGSAAATAQKLTFNPTISSAIAGLTDGALAFYGNGANTERARITSGGEFCIGTTSASLSGATRTLAVVSSGFAAAFQTTSATAGDEVLCLQQSATSGDNAFVIFKTEGGTGTGRGSITYNRGAGQVAYNVTSDVRLKENIANAEEAGSKIDAMQVRQFDWKETGNHLDYGFVAQELHAVAPHAVSKPEDEETMWSVDYSKLVPMLVKEIQSLRARVAALEAK